MSILDVFRRKEQAETIERKDRKILVMADPHCGHRCGLTPPQWWDDMAFKWGKLQRTLWDYYIETIELWKPFDLVLVNGDMIDGKAERAGGTQLITTDRYEQADMAVEAILKTGCKRVRMAYGTPYHAGVFEDHENTVRDRLIAKEVDAQIKSHVFLNVNGREINMKHKIESSSVPYGRLTALLKHIEWNRIWAAMGVQPRADILIRSHVHYCEGPADHDGTIGLVTPSLQGLGDKFGSRQCVGVVHFGLVRFDISAEGRITWEKRILQGEAQRDRSEVLFA